MPSWRYLAQRAVSGEWLSWDLPLVVDELGWDLSAPGTLRASITPDVGLERAVDGRLLVDEWSTLVYAEADGQIRWGGVVRRSGFDGPKWTVEAAGLASYPHGLPYLEEYRPNPAEPVAAIREIWRHLQAQPDGDLGVVVVGDPTPVRLGGEQPYELVWWDARDCGGEIDQLTREAPLDWTEEHRWASPTTVAHEIRVGYPRLGRRRPDLAFVQGDNVAAVVAAERDGDDYANEVVAIGKGEGRSTLTSRVPERDGRLRRAYVWSDKSVGTTDRLTANARDELAARRLLPEVRELTVVDHPNAPLASWQLGDDVLVQADVPWLGVVEVWSRVVGWSLLGDGRARLSLRRSDTFRYGG